MDELGFMIKQLLSDEMVKTLNGHQFKKKPPKKLTIGMTYYISTIINNKNVDFDGWIFTGRDGKDYAFKARNGVKRKFTFNLINNPYTIMVGAIFHD